MANDENDHPVTQEELIELVQEEVLPDLNNLVSRLEAFVVAGRMSQGRRSTDLKGT